MKNGVTLYFLGYTTSSTSTECRGGDLNPFWAYTMTFGYQSMNRAVFILSRQARRELIDLGGMVDFGRGAGNPNQETRIVCTRQLAHPPAGLQALIAFHCTPRTRHHDIQSGKGYDRFSLTYILAANSCVSLIPALREP